MNKRRMPRKQRGLYLLAALTLMLVTLSPGLAPVYAVTDPVQASSVLPSWWEGSPSSHSQSYRALPVWLPPVRPVAAPRVRPLADDTVDHFYVGVPASAIAGQPFSTTIEARDSLDALVYVTTTVALATTNGGTISPTTAELISGTWSGGVSLTTAGTGRTVRAISGTITGQATIAIQPGVLDHFVFDTIASPQAAGQGFQVTIRAYDAYGNLKTNYTGLANLSDTTGTINPTTTGSFSGGVWTGSVTITGAGSGVTITAQDGSVSNASNSFTVNPGPLDHFVFDTIASPQTAGQGFQVTIRAYDAYGNLKTNYTGSAGLSDTTGTINPTTTGSFSGGVRTVSVSITRARSGVTITAQDGSASGTSNGFTVNPASLHHIRINSAANNGGQGYGYPVEVGTHVMDIYQTYATWAAGYDQYDNYRGDLSANWGLTDVLAQGTIAPSPAISATFTPAPILSGTGTINATSVSGGFSDSTGQFEIRAPYLIISKSDDPDPVPAAGYLSYNLVYTNVGNAVAQNVRITETYDANLSFVSASPSPNISNNVWTRATLGVGESRGIFVVMGVNNSLDPGTLLTNLVTIGGSRLGQHIATETTVVTSTPELTLTLTDQPDPVNAGSNLVYQIHYENNGTAPVYNVYITMTYDDNVSYVSSTRPPETGTDNVWYIAEVAGGGGSGNINVTVVVDDFMEDQDTLVSRATINSDNTPEYSDSAHTTVRAPLLAITKTGSSDPVVAFSPLTYTLVYSNVGHAYASALLITDAVPANTDYASCQPTPCSHNNGIVTWQPGGLAAGARRTARMVVNVHRNLDPGTLLTNRARVYIFARPDYSATAQLNTTVVSTPDLWLTMSDSRTSVEAGDDVVYTLSYGNGGTGRAYNTTIVATPPSLEHVGDVTCSPIAQCSWNGTQVTYNLGAVNGGTGGTVRLIVRVHDPLPAGARVITASATISTITPGDPPGNNSAQDVDTIATRPDLRAQVGYTPFCNPDPGQRITYTVHYSNAGHIATTGVVVTATQPAYTDFDAAASSAWQHQGGGRYTYTRGPLDYNESGSLLFVVTWPTPTFTTTMPNFDASFGIYDSGISGADANPGNNIAEVPMGVPDLIVERVQVDWASLLSGQEGQHVTVTLKNQGSGLASNPDDFVPPNCGRFYIDLYINPDPPPLSYPTGYTFSTFYYDQAGPIGAGQSLTYPITVELPSNVERPLSLYIYVDNFYPVYGLVPEYNELNNVFGPVVMSSDIYLPIVLRNH